MRPDITPEASPVSHHTMKTRHPPAPQSKTRRLEALRKKAFEKFAFGFQPSSVAGMLGILLAIPFAAIFVILYHEVISPRIDRRIAKINGEETAPQEEEKTEEETEESPG